MRRLVPWIICLLVFCSRGLPAQVEEVEPSVYYLQDKDGKLVPMFGFKFEDFLQAYRQIHGFGTEASPPPFVIAEFSAQGNVVGDKAELSLRISVTPRKEGTIRVPLGLGETVLLKAGGLKAGGEESAQHIIEYNERDGYVAWINAKPDKPHEIEFQAIAPLKIIGGESILRLHAPFSTKSELHLSVPAAKTKIGGRVSEGATLETTATADAKSTEFVARGLSGDFELSWRDADVQTARKPTVLTAVGRILARVDEHSVNTEATLDVSGHGSPFDRFRVRLPQGAELLGSSPPGHTVVEVKPTKTVEKQAGKVGDKAAAVPAESAAAVCRVVEIHLAEKTLGPVTIRLATRQPHGQDNSGQLIELCGFEVEDASRQWGHIALTVADDIHVSWNRQYRVNQIDDLPDDLRQENVAAGFAYSSQPCSLQAWVVPRKTRLSVEPEHIVFVDGNDLRLESTLNYMVRGKKAFLLEVDLADWELDEVGPATNVAVDGLDVDKNNTLRIPLLRRSSGKFAITLKTHRRLPGETKDLKLHLPSPRNATQSAAAVVIQPADNIELIPNEDSNVELTRQQATSVKNLPAGYQQRPLFYRGDAAKAVFSAERSIHPRKVSVDVQSQALLEGKTCKITQRFSYRIEYQPLRLLEIDVPGQVAGRGEIEFEIGGGKVVAAALPVENGNTAQENKVALSVPLPSPGTIGQVELTIRYSLNWEEMPPRASILREIYLAMPREGKLLSNRLSLRSEPPFKAAMHDETWTVENGAREPLLQGSRLELSNPGKTAKAVIALHCEENTRQQSTVVCKSWIRTDLSGPARQDWAAFRVSCNRNELDVFLPAGVKQNDVEMLLDGKPIRPREAAENRLRLEIPGQNRQEHLLEMTYHFAESRPPAGPMSLDLPRVGVDVWNRRLYWELILPYNEHVVFDPENFVNEYTWAWNGFFWGQQPVYSRDYLLDWMGIEKLSPGDVAQLPGNPPRFGANRYVFSSFGKPSSGEYYTIGRSWIVLWASAAALVAGLIFIYVPFVRHPLALLATGLGVLSASLIFPAAALLALQAASLGFALALVAGLLERSLARRRLNASILETGSSILDKDSTQTQKAVLAPVDSTAGGMNRITGGSTSSKTPGLPAETEMLQPPPENS